MGRPEEPLDRDGSPLREFAFWLRDLRRRSGITYERLASQAHYATSTVQAAADGRRLPTLRVTMAFVAACGGDEEAWREYWTRVSRMLDADAPDGAGAPALPPWLDAAPGGVPGPASADRGAGDWFTESFTALVRADVEPVEVIERKTIVATADDVAEIAASVNVPRHSGALGRPVDLESELLYGGSLELRQQPYDSFFTNVITLPRPLRAGEHHEYAIRLRIPPGQRMAPHFLHVPFRRSDHFELRVRFDPRRPPRTVWLLRDAPTAVIYQPEPAARTVAPDRFGEVHASFRDMRPGLGYGIRWRECDQKTPGLRPAERPAPVLCLTHGRSCLTRSRTASRAGHLARQPPVAVRRAGMQPLPRPVTRPAGPLRATSRAPGARFGRYAQQEMAPCHRQPGEGRRGADRNRERAGPSPPTATQLTAAVPGRGSPLTVTAG